MYIEETTETKDGTILSIDFGKNGKGLSDELIIIGEKIKKLGETHSVYLVDSFIDAADDVYQFKFLLAEKV